MLVLVEFPLLFLSHLLVGELAGNGIDKSHV